MGVTRAWGALGWTGYAYSLAQLHSMIIGEIRSWRVSISVRLLEDSDSKGGLSSLSENLLACFPSAGGKVLG